MDIIWKKINSNTIPGLLICELPPISKPKMKTSITKIDGRDGDIIEDLGYESYTKNLKIGLKGNFDINQVIKYFTGEGSLILPNESDKYYLCRIMDKIDYEKLLRYKTATVNFYAQPFKYKNAEAEVDLTIDDETSLVVTNAGLEISKPIITLYGSGTVEISLNGSTIFSYTFPANEDEVIIDSIEEEAHLSNTYKNRNMNGIFPKLEPGNNTITWTGNLTRIKVQPKSRWL